MKKFLLGVLVGFFFAGLALVVLFFLFLRLGSAPPSIPGDAVLILNPEGQLPETPPTEIPLPMFERTYRVTVTETWEMLRKAASDSRIRAVVFAPHGLEAGWGKLQEIRHNLETFRKSGKPVYALLRSPGAREYYAATGADRIYMGPEDFLDLKGLRAELIYMKETLDKIGVQVQIVHAGKYKDAGDTFTRESMSPATRESMNSILDGLYSELVGTIARARKKSADEMRATIDKGPFLATAAAAAGLVDSLAYEDQIFDELKKRLKVEQLRRVSYRTYARVSEDSAGVKTGSRIALVVGEGTIVREGPAGMFGEELLAPEGFNRMLRRVGADGDIKGVIVRIDSPGGDAFASDEIWREMNLLSKKKPLVISMSDVAASGGYYMAMTGDPILAYPGTFTGSIGVFYGKANLRKLYDKIGVNKEILSRGRFAEIDSDYTPLGPEAEEKLRESIETFYKSFVERVATARKRPYEAIDEVAQGRVWLGGQARQNGLVDTVGGIDQAIEIVKQKARIPREETVRLVTYPRRRTIFDVMLGQTEALARPTAAPLLPAALRSALESFGSISWHKGGFFRLMPFTLEVK